MVDIKASIIWGTTLGEIRNLLIQADEIYIGLFVSSLRYKNKKQEKEEKNKYLARLKSHVEKINKEIKTFNVIREFAFGKKSQLTQLTPLSFLKMKQIVINHKGDYPEEKGSSFVQEIMGTSNSASSLSRKHTALQLRNSFMPLRLELGEFVKSLNKLEEPYLEYKKQESKFRSIVKKEIEKSMACYSINLKGEAVFIVGRLLENLCEEWLVVLKRKGLQSLKSVAIQELDFDQKLTRLHFNLKKLTPSQYSKAMALKWDRNIFGHKIKKLESSNKDAESNIKTGINLIIFLESKLMIKGKKRSRPVVLDAKI